MIIVGSLAILGTFREQELRAAATMSIEVDIPAHRIKQRRDTFTGRCLGKEDLCVAKLCASREKDRSFVAALLGAHLVDARVIQTRLARVPGEHFATAGRTGSWIGSLNR